MAIQPTKHDYTPIGPLADIITRYLEYKRSLGFGYSIEEGTLYRFSCLSCNYPLEEVNISLELLEEWCSRRKEEKATTHKARVNIILQFCYFARAYEFCVEIPELPRIKTEKYQPYIFTLDEIGRIIHEATILNRILEVLDISRLPFYTGCSSALDCALQKQEI